MGTAAKLKSIWENNRKTVIIVASCVLGALFLGSILLAIFIGGELKPEKKTTYDVKGVMVIDRSKCKTEYAVGDSFEFDKENLVVTVRFKEKDNDPEERALEADEYGFLVNGEGKVQTDASQIEIEEDTKFIRVVWTAHENIKADIAIVVAKTAE